MLQRRFKQEEESQRRTSDGLQTQSDKGYAALCVPLTFAGPYLFIFFFKVFNENAMVGSGHCNITMIRARCDLNILLPFASLGNVPHAAPTTAAWALSCTLAVTLAARGHPNKPCCGFSKCEATHKSKAHTAH